MVAYPTKNKKKGQQGQKDQQGQKGPKKTPKEVGFACVIGAYNITTGSYSDTSSEEYSSEEEEVGLETRLVSRQYS